MPIYEFYCSDCNMLFNFFSKTMNTQKRPLCPRCGQVELERRMSLFATAKRREGEGGDNDTPLPDLDESKMERAMELLTREAEGLDENDPRQAARLMRKLTDMTGLSLGSGMEEALNRMEAGEDPESIEAEMGDLMEEEEPFVLKDKGPKGGGRRPPRVDERLYDL